jgi:hypothetical protein
MRGGPRDKKKIKRGDQALLHAIWEAHGGPGEVANIVSKYLHEDIICQAPVNWRLRGRVPYKLVKAVAEALDISPLGLNYGILYNLTDDIPSWEEVVKSYGLPKGVVDMIINLKPPDIG